MTTVTSAATAATKRDKQSPKAASTSAGGATPPPHHLHAHSHSQPHHHTPTHPHPPPHRAHSSSALHGGGGGPSSSSTFCSSSTAHAVKPWHLLFVLGLAVQLYIFHRHDANVRCSMAIDDAITMGGMRGGGGAGSGGGAGASVGGRGDGSLAAAKSAFQSHGGGAAASDQRSQASGSSTQQQDRRSLAAGNGKGKGGGGEKDAGTGSGGRGKGSAADGRGQKQQQQKQKQKQKQAVELQQAQMEPRVFNSCRLETVGGRAKDGYGAWTLCADHLSKQSIVYSFGIGLDVSFDNAMTLAGHKVYGFDPTVPAADVAAMFERNHNRRQPRSFEFRQLGLGARDGVVTFLHAANPHVQSMTSVAADALSANYRRDRGLSAPVLRVRTFMCLLQHSRVDVLKMDVEGVEFDVCLSKDFAAAAASVQPLWRVGQVLMEFHERMVKGGKGKREECIATMGKHGFVPVHMSANKQEVVFARVRKGATIINNAAAGVALGSRIVPGSGVSKAKPA